MLSTVEVCRASGATYRQLDYWSRIEALVPSLAVARGSGTQRRYADGDVAVARVLVGLSALGVSGDVFREVGQRLQARPPEAWDRYLWVLPAGDVVVGGPPPEPIVVMVDLLRLAGSDDAELTAMDELLA